jgi:teichuronic acid exporter
LQNNKNEIEMSLAKKTVNGVLWNSFELFGGKAVQVVITIFLARILVPKDFGVIGLLAIFTELSKIILDSGFSQALIRKKDATQLDFSSVFYFNVSLGFVVYCILFFLAPLISSFYNFPELTNISRVVFLTIMMNSFSIVQNAKIVKDVNFKVLANRTIIANLIAGLVAIGLAYAGYGVWALVWQMVIASFLRAAFIWTFSKWMPSLMFSIASIKEFFAFSSNLLMSGLFDVIASNIQTLLIGKFYSRAELGFYSQAKQLSNLPSQTLTSVIRNVTYPTLAKMQDSKEQIKQAYKKIIRISIIGVFPLMIALMAAGDNLIPFVLGEKWMPSSLYFMVLCAAGAIFPLYSINQNIFLVTGNSKLFLRVSIAKRCTALAFIVITVSFGVLAIVIGYLLATIVNTLITMYYSGKEINYSLGEQFRDIGGIMVISFFMAASMFGINWLLTIDNHGLLLLAQAVVGTITFIILAMAFKLQVVNDLKSILSQRLMKK